MRLAGFIGLKDDIYTFCYMKTIWMILSLLFGLLFFALGCYGEADMIQYFGAAFIFAGLIGLFEKIW